jgi:AcrR family transcriptional regulator
MSHNVADADVDPDPGLRVRKRDATRRRIATAAAELATEQGIAATTVEQVVARAGVGRATFFRYFESKELAIATGLSDVGIAVLVAAVREQPKELGPLDAVRAAHRSLAVDFESRRPMFLEQALLCRSSAAMQAWTLHLYVDWEIAIADAVRDRFPTTGRAKLVDGDPRPRMVGAMAMAAARLACDEWLATEALGDLPALMERQLTGFDIITTRGTS